MHIVIETFQYYVMLVLQMVALDFVQPDIHFIQRSYFFLVLLN